MTAETSKLIDQCAINYYETRDKYHFEQFAKYARPVIRVHVAHTCIESSKWDPDELFSILFADMWRLFKVYVPETDKKFHWLMLRQLKNKTINYIQNRTGRLYKMCFVCNIPQDKSFTVTTKDKDKAYTYLAGVTLENVHLPFTRLATKSKEKGKCWHCGSSMKKPHAINGIDHYDLTHSHAPDYLKQVEHRELVDFILKETKTANPITYKILTMLLDGHTKNEISLKVPIAQNALNNRIRKCREIILTKVSD